MDNDVNLLLKECEGKQVLLVSHKNADCDSIASAVGVQKGIFERNGVESRILLPGNVTTSQNLMLYREMSGAFPRSFVPSDLDSVDLGEYGFILGVDTAGHQLPEWLTLNGAIDHHGDAYKEGDFAEFGYCDVRRPGEIGSASSIVALYMKQLGIDLSVDERVDVLTATALSVGIEMDTNLSNRTPADCEATFYLEPFVDKGLRTNILKVERSKPVALAVAGAVLNSEQIGSYAISSVMRRPRNDRSAVYAAQDLLLMENVSCSLGCSIMDDTNSLGIAVRTNEDHKVKASEIADWWGGAGKDYAAWAAVDLSFFASLETESGQTLEELCMAAVVGEVRSKIGEAAKKP